MCLYIHICSTLKENSAFLTFRCEKDTRSVFFHRLACRTFSSARVYEGQIGKHRVKQRGTDNSISARVVGNDTNTGCVRACPHVHYHPDVNGKSIILPLLTNIGTTTTKQERVNKMAALCKLVCHKAANTDTLFLSRSLRTFWSL